MLQTEKFVNSLTFFKVNISVTIKPKHLIFSLTILDIIMGGTVSQIVDLCLGFHFMKYGKYGLKKCQNVSRFLS